MEPGIQRDHLVLVQVVKPFALLSVPFPATPLGNQLTTAPMNLNSASWSVSPPGDGSLNLKSGINPWYSPGELCPTAGLHPGQLHEQG